MLIWAQILGKTFQNFFETNLSGVKGRRRMNVNKMMMHVYVCGVVLLMGEMKFVSADTGPVCGFAPLCGSTATTFDFEETDLDLGGEVLGGAEITFTDCCSLKDTVPEEDCQIVDPSGESIRVATATSPICGTNGENCDGDCRTYYLAIKPFFEKSSQTSCCSSCTCYGDPVCNSFDGTQKVWVLCDGREIPNEDSIFDMCRITQRRCEKELDNAGNQCVYLAEDSRGRDWSVGRLGSPCIPNPDSPPAKILMYEVPSKDFSFTVQHGERGIINHVYLELSCGTFDLSAEACLTYGSEAWDHSTAELPEFFAFEDLVKGKDQIWNIIDPDTGIAINLRCHANVFEDDDNLYVARINVEDLSDPVPNRRNTDGFCVTNEIDYGKATTAHTDKIIDGEYCLEGLQESDKRDIYREICRNPALPESGIESCQYHFCSEHFAPLYSSVAECEDAMNENLASGFCKAVVYTLADVDKCVNQWFLDGAIPTIQQYYDDDSGCSTEYQVSLEKCQSGIVIQYQRNNGEWADAIAIPNDFCGHDDMDGEIRISYCDQPRLFNRIIRIVQKTANIACGPVNQCTRVDGFTGLIGLVKDTPYPTTFPTISPTQWPTPFPVLVPTTSSPTTYPTMYPTNFPTTPNPTTYPTPFPNNLPTSTPYPTVFPSAAPVIGIPEFCPQPYLCEDNPTPIDIEDHGFHFAMESCCAENMCPTLDYPEQNRSRGSHQAYCQGDESYTGEKCKDEFELEIKVMFSKDESTQCCKTCTCYGDPRCYSFDGTFQEFILCDGRTIPENMGDRCIIRKKTCEEQLDHEGNPCQWGIPDLPGIVPVYSDPAEQEYYENKFSVTKYGSPCRYNEESGVPKMLLYETPDYSISVEHGDRGYIEVVTLKTVQGEYEMTADRCLQGRNWEILTGDEPDTTAFQKFAFGQEYVWKIVDVFTGIELRLRCTGVINENKYTKAFINVEEIAEPDFDRIDEADGFCATNRMDQRDKATTDNSDDIASGGYCESWNEDATDILHRNVARIITNNPGLTTAGTGNAYEKFCKTYFSPGYTSASKCISAFTDSHNVFGLITAFCKAVTSETDACEENMEVNAETDGYQAAFQVGYVQYVVNYQEQCEIKAKDLPASLNYDANNCETGVELQWYNPRKDMWLTYVAFPDNHVPCRGYTVTFKYSQDPTLFKNPLRLIQRHNFAYCSACTYTSAVDAWFTFSQ